MNTFNDAPWPMAAEQNEIVSFSFLDNTVSSKSRTFYFLFDGPPGGPQLPDL